jgi:glycosyltransferase involved in cell wall biosynthesis
MKSLGFVVANHRRREIFNLFGASIKRIKEELGMHIPCVVISDDEDKNICHKYGLFHIAQENFPVSEKWNTGFKYMQSLGVDYVSILGSDDICSTETIRRIMEEADKGYSLIGIKNVFFYAVDGLHRGQMVSLKTNRLLGVCKTISKEVIEEVNGVVCPKRGNPPRGSNWGLDAIVAKTIQPYIKSLIGLDNTVVVDMKSAQNINKYNVWAHRLPVENPQEIFSFMGEEEKQILKTL